MLQLPPSPIVHVTFTEVAMPWYSSPEMWTAVATVVLALITFGLALYTAGLYYEAKNGRVASETNLARSLRAYLIVDNVQVDNYPALNQQLPATITLTIKNCGQIPSMDTTVTWDVGVRFGGGGQELFYVAPNVKTRLIGIIGKDQKTSLSRDADRSRLDTYRETILMGTSGDYCSRKRHLSRRNSR